MIVNNLISSSRNSNIYHRYNEQGGNIITFTDENDITLDTVTIDVPLLNATALDSGAVLITKNTFYLFYDGFKESYKIDLGKDIFMVVKTKSGFKIIDEDGGIYTYKSDISADVSIINKYEFKNFNVFRLNIGSIIFREIKEHGKRKEFMLEVIYCKYPILRRESSYNGYKVATYDNDNKSFIVVDIKNMKVLERQELGVRIKDAYYLNNMTKLILTEDNEIYTYSEKVGMQNISDQYNVEKRIYKIFPISGKRIVVSLADYVEIIDLKRYKKILVKENIKEIKDCYIENRAGEEVLVLVEKETGLKLKTKINYNK